MLECILIVRDVVVIVVRISKERVASSKDVACAEIWRRELCKMRILDSEYLPCIVVEALPQLITQIGIRITITDNLYWIGGADRPVIGRDNDLIVRLCQLFEYVC